MGHCIGCASHGADHLHRLHGGICIVLPDRQSQCPQADQLECSRRPGAQHRRGVRYRRAGPWELWVCEFGAAVLAGEVYVLAKRVGGYSNVIERVGDEEGGGGVRNALFLWPSYLEEGGEI